MARLVRSVTSSLPVSARHLGVDRVRVDVQPAVLLALAGDQAHLLAAVAVRHRAAEDLLDDRALPVVQQHRGRDDAVRADVGDAAPSSA